MLKALVLHNFHTHFRPSLQDLPRYKSNITNWKWMHKISSPLRREWSERPRPADPHISNPKYPNGPENWFFWESIHITPKINSHRWPLLQERAVIQRSKGNIVWVRLATITLRILTSPCLIVSSRLFSCHASCWCHMLELSSWFTSAELTERVQAQYWHAYV